MSKVPHGTPAVASPLRMFLREFSETALEASNISEALENLSTGLGHVLPAAAVGVLNLEHDSRLLHLTTLQSVAPAFLAAMLVTFLISLLIGYPALRLRGHYLAMATLGFGLIVSKMLLGSNITGAADGINAVPEWKLVAGLTVGIWVGDQLEHSIVDRTASVTWDPRRTGSLTCSPMPGCPLVAPAARRRAWRPRLRALLRAWSPARARAWPPT